MWSYKNSSIKIWRVAFMSIDLTEASCERHYFIQICQSWNNELVHRDQCCERVCVWSVLPQACFDCRPRKISKRWMKNPALCANVPTQHQFDKKYVRNTARCHALIKTSLLHNPGSFGISMCFSVSVRCLVHAVKSSAVSYSKIRASSARCQFDVCRHELSFGCKRKDGCCFAHSLIELQIWTLQRDTGTQTHGLHLHSLHASHIQKENRSTKKLHKHDIWSIFKKHLILVKYLYERQIHRKRFEFESQGKLCLFCPMGNMCLLQLLNDVLNDQMWYLNKIKNSSSKVFTPHDLKAFLLEHQLMLKLL